MSMLSIGSGLCLTYSQFDVWRARALVLVDEKTPNDPNGTSPAMTVPSRVVTSRAQFLTIKLVCGLKMLPCDASCLHDAKYAQALFRSTISPADFREIIIDSDHLDYGPYSKPDGQNSEA